MQVQVLVISLRADKLSVSGRKHLNAADCNHGKIQRGTRLKKILTMLMCGCLIQSVIQSALICGCLIQSATALAAESQAGLDYWNSIKKTTYTTDSGLQYKILIMGKGNKPGSRSKVTVHYRGLLLNGSVFDTSYDEDEPISLSLKSVIEGWKEGIPLMPTGSVFVFLIPPELAYGENASGVIPPNATLIFEVELFKFK